MFFSPLSLSPTIFAPFPYLFLAFTVRSSFPSILLPHLSSLVLLLSFAFLSLSFFIIPSSFLSLSFSHSPLNLPPLSLTTHSPPFHHSPFSPPILSLKYVSESASLFSSLPVPFFFSLPHSSFILPPSVSFSFTLPPLPSSPPVNHSSSSSSIPHPPFLSHLPFFYISFFPPFLRSPVHLKGDWTKNVSQITSGVVS